LCEYLFIDFYIEHAAFYYGVFTLRGECYGVYMRIPDRVIITDGDGMGPCTRVHDVGCSPAFTCLYCSHVYLEGGSP
jgi:hypothetical protein